MHDNFCFVLCSQVGADFTTLHIPPEKPQESQPPNIPTNKGKAKAVWQSSTYKSDMRPLSVIGLVKLGNKSMKLAKNTSSQAASLGEFQGNGGDLLALQS